MPEPIPLPSREEFDASRPEISRLGREEFITEVFGPHYEAGQHVAIMGPTGSGKTTIAYELLNECATPKLPAIVLVMKPRDPVVKDFSKSTGFRTTQRWPPLINRAYREKGGGFGKRQRGWVFWPRHSLRSIRRDDAMLAREFRRVLEESYRKGNRIVFADEIVGLSKELNLEPELNAIWMRGKSMGCGLWAASQRPFHAPLYMYSASEHLIIFKDPDQRSVDRFKEIGGVEPEFVEHAVRELERHQFLYIGRFMAEDGQTAALAIVNAD
jgi:hypothetical protein